jgi:MscS family membrane protein
VMSAALWLAIVILNFSPSITVFGTRVANSLLIIGVFLLFYKLLAAVMETPHRLLSLTQVEIEDRLLPFLRTTIMVLVLAIGLLTVLAAWDVNINGLVASLGIIGAAIAFAAQDTVANAFGFASIVGDNPFEVGDFISTSDATGIVEHVGVRSTRLRQLNKALVTVPNSQLNNKAVLNWSRLDRRQIDFVLGVTYSTNASQMRHLLNDLRDLLRGRESVDPDSIVVNFIDFGSSSLNILVRCDVLLAAWAEFTAEREVINLQIMELIDRLGLSIAFPSTSVYIDAWPAPGSGTRDAAHGPPGPRMPGEFPAADRDLATTEDAVKGESGDDR